MAISAGAVLFADCAAQTHAMLEIIKARIPRRFIFYLPVASRTLQAGGIVSLSPAYFRQYFLSRGPSLQQSVALEIFCNYFRATLDTRGRCCMIMQCYV
jgi:hypothetical protein